MKLLAEAMLPVVSETTWLQPFRRARYFRSAHETQLQAVAPMRLDNADAAKIAGVSDMRRGYYPSESDRNGLMTGEPPMPPDKGGNRGAAKEGQTVQFGQEVRGILILTIDLADPIGWLHDFRHRPLSENPRARAQASAAASPYWATARLTIRQEISSAGDDASRAVSKRR